MKTIGDYDLALDILDAVLRGRCYACGWTLAPDDTLGCVPFDCSFRPADHSVEHARWLPRAQAMATMRQLLDSRRNAPPDWKGLRPTSEEIERISKDGP